MVEIQAAAKSEPALMGKIISDGFLDDTVNQWCFNGTQALLPMYSLMAQHLYLPKGYGHRTTDGKAGTLWLPPGVSKGYGLRGNLAMAYTLATKSGARGILNSLILDKFLSDNRPKEPHHYLFAIAVHPSLQGKGIGGKLMRLALSRIDHEHMPTYLENSKSRNIPFYQSFGFEIMKEVQPAKGCPPMWLMWRKATPEVKL